MLNSTHPMAGRNRPRMMKRRLSEAAISPRLVAASAELAPARSAAAERPRPAPATERLLPPLPLEGAPAFLSAMELIWLRTGPCFFC